MSRNKLRWYLFVFNHRLQCHRDLDRQFYQDACILEEALDREKGLPRAGGRLQKVHNGNVIVDSAEVVNKNAAKLTNKAKALRETTDATFKDVIAHWQKQVDDLEKELETYRRGWRIVYLPLMPAHDHNSRDWELNRKLNGSPSPLVRNKSNTAQARVEKRTTEIENLRLDNARIAGLLEQCESRINEMINYMSSEKQEQERAQYLSDQVYDAKKMKVNLKQRVVDAERLMAQTRGEKRSLLEENRVLKGATAELRHKLKESTNDTRQTKQELEELEKIMKNAEQRKPRFE